MMTFADINDIISTLYYKDPVSGESGGSSCYAIKSETDRSFVYFMLSNVATTPRMNCPYGISKPFDKTKPEGPRKSLDMSYFDPKLEEALMMLDEYNIKYIAANYKKWFGKAMSEDTVRSRYVSCIKRPEDPQYGPKVRIKINTTGALKCKFKVIQPDKTWMWGSHTDITPGCEVVAQVRCAGLWFASGKFGGTLEGNEIVVFPRHEANGAGGGIDLGQDFKECKVQPTSMEDTEQATTTTATTNDPNMDYTFDLTTEQPATEESKE